MLVLSQNKNIALLKCNMAIRERNYEIVKRNDNGEYIVFHFDIVKENLISILKEMKNNYEIKIKKLRKSINESRVEDMFESLDVKELFEKIGLNKEEIRIVDENFKNINTFTKLNQSLKVKESGIGVYVIPLNLQK